MKTKVVKPRVVFNASVIFSSFRSSTGASRALMTLLKQNRMHGIISETILNEALKHAPEIPLDKERLRREIQELFPAVVSAPKETHVRRYLDRMIDRGDAHLFATCKEARATHLVSPDKHHILIFARKIPRLHIVPPAELLKELRTN